MSETLIGPQPSGTAAGAARSPAWKRSLRKFGSSAARVHLAGESDSDTAPARRQILSCAEVHAQLVARGRSRGGRLGDLSGARMVVEIGDLELIDPPVQIPGRLALDGAAT